MPCLSCTLPSLHLFSVVFGTAIPTSLYIFGKCFSYFIEGGKTRRPVHQRTCDEQHITKEFSKLMSQGKVKAAIQLFDNHNNGGSLSLNDAIQSGNVQILVHDGLIPKHPQDQPPHPETVLCPPLLV